MYISKKDFIQVLNGNKDIISRLQKEYGIGDYKPKERICKYCGKPFTPKGNYKSSFCDRIPTGEKHSCKYLGAAENRKKKLASNTQLKAREREYKKIYARMLNGLITREEFEKWKLTRDKVDE